MKTQKTISAYHHQTDSTQIADPSPGNYYCSVRDGQRTGLLLGPFTNHQAALNCLAAAKSKAFEVCRDSVWYAFGTVKMKDGFSDPGTLNRFFPELFQTA